MNYVKFAILPQISTTIKIQPLVTQRVTTLIGEIGSRINLSEECV